MTATQTLCLAVTTLITAYWCYIFFLGGPEQIEQSHGKLQCGTEYMLLALSIAGVVALPVVFISIASFFQADTIKRLVLQAYTICYGSAIYIVMANKPLYVADAYKANLYILSAATAVALVGGFVLSPAAPQKKKRF